MKRHIQLQPLSRQHHNGLLAVLLLRKGLDKAASLKDMAAFILTLWQQDLAAHFAAEENVLLPAVPVTTTTKTNIKRLLDEHRQIRGQISLFEKNAPTSEAVKAFAALLEQHIRFEERIFFPLVETLLSEATLAHIGAALHEDLQNTCMNYPVKFWE
ncbi:hemerythrin domain-containing protein [Panacibacter sp. DH6]|uniref:Hemerythrin domain-containing protein n=1 Tax=Panacibacter microcysteis TaxID=2793269 RepID=A0A931H0B9_9BACT|nr:hemerythrin domain-containing protein [Panacibacter microcysteis]MBG9378649.1 hemerythrin domain-containing protein [Panacibacter microcysteis]